KAFAHEYRGRFEADRRAGAKTISIEAPAMLAASPVTASAFIAGHEPGKAFDGIHTDLASSWQTDPYPAWLQIDLGEIKEINWIQVFPF
ncbi:MAG: discoidin domain-containing protein, partial [Planctomycetes bacterium]|nr:discoidin domain-containing protein [Planctomycetota bacterium]